MGCSSSIAEKYKVEEVRGGDIAPDAPSFHNDFELSRKLGKGAFGSVYLAWRRDGVREKVAVKVADLHQVPQGGSTTDAKSSVGMDSKSTVKITKSGLDTRRKRTTEKEVRVLKALPKSEYIVAYYADYCEGGISYIVMELCSMSLLQAFGTMPRLTESTMKLVLRDMLKGLVVCHRACIVHRDVKADNFLAVADDSRLGFRAKLCDFGLAGSITRRDACELAGVFGTPPYMAPEMLFDQKYGAKVDTWAFGALAYVLTFGTWPYSPPEYTGSKMKKAIIAGEHGPTFKAKPGMPEISAACVAWVQALLERDPEKRCSSEAALAHPSFNADWENGADSSLLPVILAAKRIGGFDCGAVASKSTQLDAMLMGLNRCHKRKDSSASDQSTIAGSDSMEHCPTSP